jgi:uncharacterized repeat protein (TIGR03803 family)
VVPGGKWSKTTIFKFAGASGIGPDGLVFGADGNVYGTAYSGAMQCERKQTCGTVFELIPPSAPGGAWTEQTVHAFSGTATRSGANPDGLSLGPDGNLYGTTLRGGAGNGGTVFQIKP